MTKYKATFRNGQTDEPLTAEEMREQARKDRSRRQAKFTAKNVEWNEQPADQDQESENA